MGFRNYIIIISLHFLKNTVCQNLCKNHVPKINLEHICRSTGWRSLCYTVQSTEECINSNKLIFTKHKKQKKNLAIVALNDLFWSKIIVKLSIVWIVQKRLAGTRKTKRDAVWYGKKSSQIFNDEIFWWLTGCPYFQTYLWPWLNRSWITNWLLQFH
jgi:hypothetical protein